MTAYYNENNAHAAQWLRNLISAGHITPGDVDERSIVDVRPDDLKGYTQAHFFAGIGGWSEALRLAGWPDRRHVWTGSCPCQPLSCAGQRKGHADERHLWPAFHRLIAERRPAIVFGEQVASADGREWFSAVRADLEALGYACGAADLCAASAGAPQIRQRIFWLACSDGGDASAEGLQRGREQRQQPQDDQAMRLGGANGARRALGIRLAGNDEASAGSPPRQASLQAGHWSDCDWLPCTDGKARPVEAGTFPPGHGIPGRLGRLRAYGNAIVPQVAAAFIAAAMLD